MATGRPTGRLPLDRSDPTEKICLAVTGKDYDRVHQAARSARISVPEVIRRALRHPDISGVASLNRYLHAERNRSQSWNSSE